MDMSKLTDVLVPYKYEPQRLTSKLYKGVETVDIVYKKANGYELILSVDKAVSDKPAPFMIYLHGGGWRTSNNGSSKVLSQYLAKQAGITGVRVPLENASRISPTFSADIRFCGSRRCQSPHGVGAVHLFLPGRQRLSMRLISSPHHDD